MTVRFRSAITGRYVTPQYAKRHSKTTVKEVQDFDLRTVGQLVKRKKRVKAKSRS